MHDFLRPKKVHVIGAGLAGLAAATDLAARGIPVVLSEAAPQAGGRCRSYWDAMLGLDIDNGNHLILSGNHATLAYLDRLGARDGLEAAPSASFPFMDLATNERWTVGANDGPIPWWLFVAGRRVPGVKIRDYVSLFSLLRARKGKTIGDTIDCSGPLYHRLLEPFLLAALNIDPPVGSALLAARVIRETLAAGGRHYHPMIARQGLSATFVAPALRFIEARGGTVTFARRLRGLHCDAQHATGLDFGDDRTAIDTDDAVILAVPPQVAKALVPEISAPTRFRAIVNAHYRTAYPVGTQPMIGVVNGLAQWIFAFPGRLSVTISAGDDHMETSREDLAQRIWRDVAKVVGIDGPMPPWQIVRERRATFEASPEQDATRPTTRTRWNNLALAGDWTQTGLPATIEGAIRSGISAARLVAPT